MKLVVALLFIIDGQIDSDKTVYYEEIDTCRYWCQEYSRDVSYYESMKCVCKLAWVNSDETIIE